MRRAGVSDNAMVLIGIAVFLLVVDWLAGVLVAS